MGLFPQNNVLGHINRRKPVFSCRVDDLPSVHRFAKEPTAQRATSKNGFVSSDYVLGHINRRRPVFSCRVNDLPSVHRFAKEPTAQRATSKNGFVSSD